MSRSGLLSAFVLVSIIASATAYAAAPAAPSELTATSAISDNVTLRWKDNSNNETGFEVQYRIGTTGTFYTLGGFLANTEELSLQVTGNITYQFQVRSYLAGSPYEFSEFEGPMTIVTPGMTSADTAFSLLGQPFAFQLTSNQSAPVTSYSISALPPGLSLDPATGLISGIPTALGKAFGNVRIEHSDGKVVLGKITLRVFKSLPALAPPVIGTPLEPVKLILGTPATVPLPSHFQDPDVSKAARLITDSGTLDFAFYPETAPQTVANFLGYASRGDFANTIFHRSVSNFIVQGGGFRADVTASAVPTQPPVVNEPAITNARGTVAMAKVGTDPNSATNQFFINLADNSENLNNQNDGFTVFARVAGNGMAVADAIATLPRGDYSVVNNALTDTPVRVSPAPVTYDPSVLVRISSVSEIPPLAFICLSTAPEKVVSTLNGTDLTLTPVTPGNAMVTVTATDLDGQTVSSDLPVTVLDTYATWSVRQGFANAADADSTADPDHDGLTNFEEYALATGPLAPTTSNPAGRITNRHLEIAFTLNTWAAGTLVTVQSATGLAGPWADVWKSTDGFNHPWIANSTLANGVASVVARDPATIPDPTTPRKFLRLKFN